MVPLNNLRPDLSGKSVNETHYRGFNLKGYSDSDYAGCNMDRKITSGACQLLGGKLVCWSAKKQQSIAMSSAKAKYVAAARCCANILWMKSQLTDYDIIYEKYHIIVDNTSAIANSNNLVLHSRTKHIDIRYHFIRDRVLKGDIELHVIPTQYQLVVIFTKPLDEPTFKRLIVENVWISSPTGGVKGEIGITTFRNTVREQYLPHSSTYVPPPSITTVRPWFATIGYKGEIRAKGTLKKSCLPPRWRLLMAQIMQCLGGKTMGPRSIIKLGFGHILYCLALELQVVYAKSKLGTDLIHKLNKKSREKICPYLGFLSLLLEHMMPEYENEELTINPTQMFLWTPKLQTLPHQLRRFPKAKSGLKRKRSSKHTSESTTEASKSQTGQSKKETKSSSAKDKILSHPLPPTPVVGEMHKEAQKAAGGPTSLGATSKEGAHPQLSSAADDISLKIKREYLSDILKDTRFAFFTPNSPPDEPIIVLDESEEEEEVAKDKDTKATSHDEIEKDAKVKPARHKGEIRKEELIDLFGTEVVNKYYNNKLQYDRYCDKMLNRRAKSRITNYDILTRKGLITLKVYKDNDISEIIPEFKATDLHLSEWREVVKAFRNKKGKGWTSIYKQILERMNYLRTTKAELGIDIDRPLTNKRLKSSVQYEDYPAGTMLNEPILGMILFNSYHRHDFVTIKDFRDFPNTILYTVQEVFFRLYQGRGFDDHARTFSSLLLAEIDKRNLNPLKQMRVVEMRHRM
ncbi:hypothetical protein Tco_1237408 [Tanacetum coccineum]